MSFDPALVYLEQLNAVSEELEKCRAERQQAIDERDAALNREQEVIDTANDEIRALQARCEQAIDALREIAHTLSCSSPLVTQNIARAALLNLGEQP